MIIDAGSSGSRVHIYRYTISGANRLPIVRQRGQVLKTKLALSTFVTHPDNSGDSLAPLIQYAEEQVLFAFSWCAQRSLLFRDPVHQARVTK